MKANEFVPVSLQPSHAPDRDAAGAGGETLLAPEAAGFAARRSRVESALRRAHWVGALALATCCAVLMGVAGVALDQSDGAPGGTGLWSLMARPSALAWLAVMGVFAAEAFLPALSSRRKRAWLKTPRARLA